ncbi:hypothetical protein [Rhodovulum sp.]|uniref:hypothetical protein n=1 Tax=Rhodovulum sp. TaxID=34009 RepID=UPI0039C8D177
MNIPACCCTGYLGDGGAPEPHPPGDFADWMEVFPGGCWRVFEPRNDTRRIARILIVRGRDAADVANDASDTPAASMGRFPR